MNDFTTGFTLQLFHLSDQEANTTSVELAPNLSAVLNTLSAQDIDGDGEAGYADTLVLSSGDAWIPGLFYDASEDIYGIPGAADILIQNLLGVQAISFGNHEFDNGNEIIAQLLSGEGFETPEGGQPFDGAEFPYLAGNLDYSQDPNLGPLATADGQNVADIPGQVSGTALVTTEGGETIGLVSAVVPTIDDGLSSPDPELIVLPESNDLTDLAALIQEDVDALLAANPDLDKVILLSHQQVLSREEELATLLEDVDIIMAGGSNSILLDENDQGFGGEAADGVYPKFFDGADGAPVAVINTDRSYEYLGRLVIDFDDQGQIIPDSYDAELSGAFATDAAGLERIGAAGNADPEIEAIAAAVEETILEGESNFFAVTTEFLNAERNGGGVDGVRTQETNLGNLTADANLQYVQQFDDSVIVSFKNGGGIRANIGSIVQPGGEGPAIRIPPEGVPGAKPEGGISENNVADTLAFNNGLTLLSLTTEQLVRTIESTLESYESQEESAGGWGQFGGLRFSFDPELEPGDRVVNAAVVGENGDIIARLVEDGEIVDNGDQTFRTVTLDFLANGGSGGLPVTSPDEEGFDPDIAAATNRVDLVDGDNPTFTGGATFAPDGSEQDALAEYLLEEFGNQPGDPTFDEADRPVEQDTRIQNLDFRADTVFEDAADTLRVASFNASLNRNEAGELISDLSTGDDTQAQNVAQIIQRENPDIIIVNEFDFDAEGEAARLFQENYLGVSQGGETPVTYENVYVAPSNTGVDSGFDLNGDGETGGPNDAFGFGFFPGQFGFAIFSKYEIDEENIRTFQEFLWADMPGNLLEADTDDTDPLTDLLDQEAIDNFRLSSKNHVDLPVIVNGETVHVLAAHPTPPVFDDPTFDLNGKRNFDEIRFWSDYVDGADYIVDDEGTQGGLADGERFVIVGDYNSDPFDGDSRPGAAQQIIENPAVLGSATDASITPSGPGGVDNGTGGVNADHQGNPAFDTADFGFNADDPANDVDPGNLRVDYALPSVAGFQYVDGTVVWPANDDPFAEVTNFPTSDHRMVHVDLRIIEDAAEVQVGLEQNVAASDVRLADPLSALTVAPIDGGFAFRSADSAGAANLYGADTIAFADASTEVVESDATAEDLALIYLGAFDRTYDVQGASFWEGIVEDGVLTADQLGSVFVDSLEFASTNGADLDAAGFVDAVLDNLDLAGTLEDTARDQAIGDIETGARTRGDVLVDLATSEESRIENAGLIDDGVILLA